MQQKIIQIGNSVGLILPQNIREKLSIKHGDSVVIETGEDNESITIRRMGARVVKTVSPRFLRIIEKVNKHYAAALTELAGK